LSRILRGLLLALASVVSVAASAASMAPRAEPTADAGNLSTIAGWLRLHGREGFIGADVADAMGIERAQGEAMVAARQRGFRNDAELRVAQVSADTAQDFILFMVQRPEDVYFYLSTPGGGLQKAFVSIPSKNLVMPLSRGEAELRFLNEVMYWKDRSVNP
jgi:hypothetical protein